MNLTGDGMLIQSRRNSDISGLTLKSTNVGGDAYSLIITDNFDNPPEPTSRLDVDGDLRVRDLPSDGSHTKMVTVASNGTMGSATMFSVKDKTTDFAFDDMSDRDIYSLTSGAVNITLNVDALSVGASLKILATSGSMTSFTSGAGVVTYGSVSTIAGGRGAQLTRLNDDGADQIYHITTMLTSAD